MRVSGRRISTFGISNERFWQVAILTAAGAIGATSQADAALYYWQDNDPGTYQQPTPAQPRRQKVRRHQPAKNAVAEKETGAKPQGPLVISVSIENQKVRVYDANGLFAESPVSTGMAGHSTPMGAFSIIQKDKFHRSNIYSGAPMPYMLRITWSGIAMHAGVLPGYPASHGCIRMPMAFAMKMWNWTRMGARVVVTPGEMTPASFSHPLLATQKVVPQPVAALDVKVEAPFGVKSDKGADAGAAIVPAASETNLELRSTVGHAESASLRDQTHTADASGAMSAASASVTMSDAAGARASSGDAAATPSDDAAKTEAQPDTAAAVSTETAAADEKPAEPNSAETEKTTTETAAATQAGADTLKEPAKTEVSASDSVRAEAKAADTKPEAAKADAPKVETPKAAEKPAETVKAADAPAVAPDAKKDAARLPGLAKPELPKRSGQIAVFISRKDSKLYVRQEFKPLFDVPVTIAPSDRPLGTHVFTAEVDKTDTNLLRWSVVTLPARNKAARNDEDDRPSRRRKMAGAPAEAKLLPAPDSPAEALDRITIPPDAMARITEALTTGASIIVSDQGINQGETGEGTDFIVSLR
jgi:lipoprotein-anchoring transpeptidase ErfK/SrfK